MPQKSNEVGPLAGLRVLDVGTMIAGPLAATLLADFGASVIKVEHPKRGDAMRDWTPMKDGKSLWWKVIARNKKLITLNLSSREAQSLLLRLVRDADVLVENFRPGTMERWGLGFSELSAANPDIIMVRVSGFGQTGPYSKKPGYGTIAEAMTGIPHFTGFPDSPPTLPPIPLGDSVAATFGAMGAMFAIYRKDHGKEEGGQVVDVSLFEPLFRLAESMVIGFDQLGIVKERMGNRLAEDSPRNTYETKDGEWVAISASSQRTFNRLAQAIDRPDMIEDPRFRDNPSRIANADELDGVIAAWFAERTLEETVGHLNSFDVVAGPVYDVARIFDDPHYRARQAIVDVPDEDFGNVRMQAAIPKFSHTPGAVLHSGLRLGAHNEDIYVNQLGLTREELADLRVKGVV